ncbi:polysaccharide biosynthesis C-terminal domain-containing protein, partial [Patescibacteria group bacterium]|nr:polysaccharide biosynthesis C-terminal domain-containing protein [Patescibacteria group bacterium]MBU1963011.1 polysaccharide biosynthesis C-terminal domain-containing protein [Patescibacteria group bacterium]
SFLYFPKGTDIMLPLAVAVGASATVFALLTGTISTVLQVNYKMQYNAAASIVGKIVALMYMTYVIFIWNPGVGEAGFYHLFFAGILGNVSMFAITWYYARKYARIRYQFDWSFIKKVVIKSLPYGLALILNNLYFRIGSIMLLPLAGPEQTALYGLPLRILEAIAILPLYFMNAVLPTLTKTLKEKTDQYKKVIQYSFDALVMGGIPMAVGMSVISYQVIYLLSSEHFLSRLSEGFYGSDLALQIVIFALAFSFINTLFGFILVAIGRQSKLLYINGSGAILAIILNFLIIPHLGARGAAITDITVEMFVAISAYFFAKKYLDFSINLKNAFKIIFASVVMGAAIYYLKDPTYHLLGLQNKNILLLIPLGGAIYIALLFAMKVITKDMLLMLKKEPGLVKGQKPIEPDSGSVE